MWSITWLRLVNCVNAIYSLAYSITMFCLSSHLCFHSMPKFPSFMFIMVLFFYQRRYLSSEQWARIPIPDACISILPFAVSSFPKRFEFLRYPFWHFPFPFSSFKIKHFPGFLRNNQVTWFLNFYLSFFTLRKTTWGKCTDCRLQ